MVERQLRGRYRQEWNADGLTVEMTLPGSLEVLGAPSV
jgi:YD repeat-containing protein